MMRQAPMIIMLAAAERLLDDPMVAALAKSMEAQGASLSPVAWIDKGLKGQWVCEGLSETQIYNITRSEIGSKPIDVLVRKQNSPAVRLFIADMESTIIEQEMLDELADTLGLRDKVAEITRRGMNGEINFADSLKERTALLKGLPAQILDDAAQKITPMKGAKELVSAMKKQKAPCWLVSGGFSCFTDKVAQQLGFDRAYSNELAVKDGVITGDVVEPIRDGMSKRQTLELACRELGIDKADCLAIGDGANDLPMINACHEAGGFGVAFHAKPVVRSIVMHQINHTHLDTLAMFFRQTENSHTSDKMC